MGCKWGRGSQGSCKGGFAHEDRGKTSSRGHMAEPPWQDWGAGTPKMPPGDAVLGASTAPAQLPFIMCLGPSAPAQGWILPPCPALQAQTLPSHQGRGTSRWGTATEATQGPRGWGGCRARCPGVTGGWQCGTGASRAWDRPRPLHFLNTPAWKCSSTGTSVLGCRQERRKLGSPAQCSSSGHPAPGGTASGSGVRGHRLGPPA